MMRKSKSHRRKPRRGGAKTKKATSSSTRPKPYSRKSLSPTQPPYTFRVKTPFTPIPAKPIAEELDAWANEGRHKPHPVGFQGSAQLTYLFMQYFQMQYTDNWCRTHFWQIPPWSRYDSEEKYFKMLAQTQLIRTSAEDVAKCIRNGAKLVKVYVELPTDKPGTNHSNLLIFNPTTLEVHRMEPHGGFYQLSWIMHEDELTDIFNWYVNMVSEILLLPAPFKYVRPLQGCFALQLKQDREELPRGSFGYCLLWTTLFTELLLRHTDLTFHEVYEQVTAHVVQKKQEDPLYLNSVIKGYFYFLEDRVSRLEVLLENNEVLPLTLTDPQASFLSDKKHEFYTAWNRHQA
jgi:hypothetical protein